MNSPRMNVVPAARGSEGIGHRSPSSSEGFNVEVATAALAGWLQATQLERVDF